MLYLTAFITGLLGSFHCLGMCGPIAMIVPPGQSYGQFIYGRLLYNFGRIGTYALLGLLLGIFGQGLQLAGVQQYVSVVMGVILLSIAISKITGITVIKNNNLLNGYKKGIEKQFSKFISRPGAAAQVSIGCFNGLLPCGLVYIGLAGAVTTATAASGAAYMALFGLGTLPMMLGVSLTSRWVTKTARTGMLKAMPYFVACMAILFIIRGLNLGIPYLSPKLNSHNQMECCEKPH